MRKINYMSAESKNRRCMSLNDDVYDPDDNLYNRPEDRDISTISYQRRMKVKNDNTSKKRKINRNNEKTKENAGEFS